MSYQERLFRHDHVDIGLMNEMLAIIGKFWLVIEFVGIKPIETAYILTSLINRYFGEILLRQM